MSDHGLRTTGRHTGNFGRAKVQGKRESLDLSSNLLKKENLKVPDPKEAYLRLAQAYEATDDPKLKEFLGEQLRQRRATRIRPENFAVSKPSREHWEEVKRVR